MVFGVFGPKFNIPVSRMTESPCAILIPHLKDSVVLGLSSSTASYPQMQATLGSRQFASSTVYVGTPTTSPPAGMLETRPDIDHARLAYFGFSAGAVRAPIVLATEPRFQAAVLAVGGLEEGHPTPEADAFQFAPRARTPVLMLNGRYDLVFDLETSQRPLLQLFGASPANKKLVLLEAGHAMVGFPAATRESLDWLDRYLGPVPPSR